MDTTLNFPYAPSIQLLPLVEQLQTRIADLEKLNSDLQQRNDELQRRNVELEQRVKELEASRSKKSHNSSKPSSTDVFKKPKRTKSQRKATGRKPGGQKGHQGNTLRLSDTPDQQDVHIPNGCCDQCGQDLDGLPVNLAPEKRQVFDLPEIKFTVVEHRIGEVQCTCGKVHRGSFPDSISQPTQYGPNTHTLATYLGHYQFMPYDRMRQFFLDVTGQAISVGTLSKMCQQGAYLATPVVEQIKEAVIASPVANFDETGLRVNVSLKWLHTASTTTLTWYGVHEKRGNEATDAHGILPVFKGTAVHDNWAPYWKYSCAHSLCNAHHLRELEFIAETTGQEWPRTMQGLLREMKQATDLAKEIGRKDLPVALIESFERDYDQVIEEGFEQNPEQSRTTGTRGRIKQTPAYNLLSRLRQRKENALLFLRDLSVPFDNNTGEQAMRMPKVKIKISGCFRTEEGASNFGIVRSYLDTLRKQGIQVYSAIRNLFTGKLVIPSLAK